MELKTKEALAHLVVVHQFEFALLPLPIMSYA